MGFSRGSDRKFGWILVLVGLASFVGLGVPTVLVAVNNHRPTWVTVEGTVTETGRVVTNDRERGGLRTRSGITREKIMYSPSAVYRTPEDELTCRMRSRTSTQYWVGDPVDVRYDPAKPRDCQIDPEDLVWLPWVLGGMAVAFLAIFGGIGVRFLSPRASSTKGVGQPSR